MTTASDTAVAACCEVMVREMGQHDQVEANPSKGLGGDLINRYALPRRFGCRLPRSFFSKLMG